MKATLSDAIEDYIGHLDSMARSKAHLKSSRICLRRLLTLVGNILTENVNEAHVDMYFREASRTRSPRSLGLDTAILKGFFRWAIRTRRAGRSGDPLAGRTAPKTAPREWRGFPVSKVPALLDSATHPRDRMLLALACFLLGRSAEFTLLKIRDVQLEMSGISYQIPKTLKSDFLPICEELDEELRRWLTAYAEECGPLDPSWYLVPAKTPPRINGNREADDSAVRLLPEKRLLCPFKVAHKALEAIGHPLKGADGQRLNEGMHTIRRSMARGLYEQLRDEGDVNPVETVRSMLNHSTEKQTRDYIGLQSERIHRDARLRGRVMFPGLRGENVRHLDTERQLRGV